MFKVKQMNFKFHFFYASFLWIYLIFASNAHTQEIDLKTYIDLVKNNNITLKQGDNRRKIAKAESKIAQSFLLPNASFEGFYQRDFNKNFLFINDEFDGSTTAFRTNFDNTIDLGATVTQTLFDPIAFSTAKIAKLAEELNILSNENTSNELISEASTLYWQAIFVRQSIKVLKENSELAKEQVNQIKKVYDKGVVSELELHQAEALYKKTIPPVNNAQNQYNNILNELKALANIQMTENLVLTDRLETIGYDILFESKEITIENQPEIKTIRKEIEITEKQIEAKRKFWYPQLNLVAGYNYNGQDNDFRFGNNENKLFFGQIRISFPIFSGGRNDAEITKAKIEKESAELHLKNKQQEFLKQLQIAENNYNNTVNNIAVHQETIQLNEKEIEVFNKQLKLGVVTPIEFKEARLRLTQSKLDLLNDYLDLHIAILQVRRILGKNM